MKTKYRNFVAIVGLTLLLLFASPFQIYFPLKARAQQNAPQPVSLKVSTKNVGGALELTGDTLIYGDLKVYLPDDMAAGDTISGTVVAEPKGSTEEERAKNQEKLEGYVVEVGDQKASASDPHFKWSPPALKANQPPRYSLRIIEAASGREVANTTLPVLPVPPNFVRPQTITPSNFQLPIIGQKGRPVEITGPFDGDFSNTTVNWSAAKSAMQESQENGSGEFGLLAESPRKAIFRSPANATGPMEISLKEGSVDVKGLYRNVGVNLSAPKTNLQKGESTTLTVQVNGLQGITQGIPLLLVSQGVIRMDGGNTQFFLVPPLLVTPAGTFTTTRTLTGQQAGGFSVVATVFVKPLESCLQDDKGGGIFLLNSTTGDYIFTQPGVTSLGGKGTVTKKDCAITLTDAQPDRKVEGKIDPCMNTGSASVQMFLPKMKFTITDRNTKDNTCAVH